MPAAKLEAVNVPSVSATLKGHVFPPSKLNSICVRTGLLGKVNVMVPSLPFFSLVAVAVAVGISIPAHIGVPTHLQF